MAVPGTKLKESKTAKFSVLDLSSMRVDHVAKANARRVQERLTSESGPKVKNVGQGKIGGDFQVTKEPAYLQERCGLFDTIKARRSKEMETADRAPIVITLPDGSTQDGVAWETSPFDVAMKISKGLAEGNKAAVVAKVTYAPGARLPTPGGHVMTAGDGLSDDEDEEVGDIGSGAEAGELWDMTRPLEGSCSLELLKFDSDEGRMVFWHSSAHVLGETLEHTFGSYLTIGPPVAGGFYYDSYMGEDNTVSESDFKRINETYQKIAKSKQKFERLIVTKDEALELFEYNPFKSQLIATKVPDGSRTTVYRNGDLIDLCRGPHLKDTGAIKSFATLRNSATQWLGEAGNDSLQRVVGVAFPDKKLLKEYLEDLKKAEERDHRRIGKQQKLFMFNDLSPGSAFWLPHGAAVYNTLVDFIKGQYWARGYTEVITPNVYNSKLWERSGHWQHYAENMFQFDVEGQTFALKPMNCPGHCVMFGDELRSYRDLPMRYADFGTLHRNELSGALTGLTRVRRFQQDDAHIFCRRDQIKDEVLAALDFMKFVYDTFGMTYKLELSTRPKKALGDIAIWNDAEAALAEAMDEFAGKGSWRINPGDGAFYGPKIDIKVMDAMKRIHQCATVQLDFQLPIRFDLKYKAGSSAAASGTTPSSSSTSEGPSASKSTAPNQGYERPIIIHRAMLGSVERMAAVLIEHYGGKWPFWLSPRQCMVVPIKNTINEYAEKVGKIIHDAGYFVEVDTSGSTMQKKVRESQLAQFNFILVVGEKEMAEGTVNVRLRNNEVKGTKSIEELLAIFKEHKDKYLFDPDVNVAAGAAEKE